MLFQLSYQNVELRNSWCLETFWTGLAARWVGDVGRV
jgi:hypothetical protein